MMVVRALGVLFLAMLTSSPTSEMCGKMTAGVIKDLGKLFHSGGAYFLVSSEQVAEDCWSNTVRLLTNEHMPTAIIRFEQAFLIPFPPERMSVYVMYSAGMEDISAMQELLAMFDMHLAVWLLFLEDNVSVEYYFSGVHVPFNCRFLVAKCTGETVQLTEVYRVTSRHPLTLRHYGVWKQDHPLSLKGNFYDGRNNLQGLSMRAISMNNLPYSVMEMENSSYKLRGSIAPIWRMMEETLNFTTEYQFSEDNFAGSLADNGSWRGLIGVLSRQEIDVAVSAITMTPMRTEVVDFTLPIFLNSYKLFIRQPNAVDVDWGNFLAPFHSSLWLSILVIIFVVSVLVEACHRLVQRFGNSSAEWQHRPFFQDSLFHVFSAFCSQGHDMTYRTMSIRVLFLAAHMTAVVLLAAYSAGLISSLTMQTMNLPFSTFEELLNDGTHAVGVVNNSAAIWLFSETKDPLLREVYTELIASDPENFPSTTLEGMRRVCSIKFAFLSQMSGVQNIRHDIPCKIVDLPATSITVNLAIAFTKGNPYRDVINHNLRGMRRAGILQKLQLDYGTKGQRVAVRNDLESVNLGDAAPLLVVLGVSVLVGVFLLVLERKARRMMMCRSYVTDQSSRLGTNRNWPS